MADALPSLPLSSFLSEPDRSAQKKRREAVKHLEHQWRAIEGKGDLHAFLGEHASVLLRTIEDLLGSSDFEKTKALALCLEGSAAIS